MKKTNLILITTFIMIFMGSINTVSAGEMRAGDTGTKGLPSLQTIEIAIQKIFEFYQKDKSTAYAKVTKYLENVPWDLQLSIFDALAKTSPEIPGYDFFRNPRTGKNEITLNITQYISKDELTRQAEILLDILRKNNYHNDIASIIFTNEFHLFPGSTVIASLYRTNKHDDLEQLVKYASQDIRLNSVAFYIMSKIYRSGAGVSSSSSILNAVKALINNYNIFNNISVAPLILQIDSWINRRQMMFESRNIETSVKISNQYLEGLKELSDFLKSKYPN